MRGAAAPKKPIFLPPRASRAREVLQETDLPLAEMAERAGFRHQEYMGAVFRRRLKVTPGSLRRTRWRA